LRFVLDCVLSSTAFCLFKDHLLRFAKDKLCQTQNCIAFCLSEALRKCILSGPYKPTTVLVQAVEVTDDSPAIPEHTTPEWSRFVTIVKQQHKLDEVTYHKLFDILKQYQNKVNELRVERKPKSVKDFAYHKEKMLMCKQAEQGVPLQVEQYDWLVATDEEVDVQELEAHYNYMAKIQEQSESVSNTCLVETDDSNVTPNSPDMCEDDIQNEQNDVESNDERVALANLISNLKLDVDENKRIQKQLKKANTSLAQELKECKTILAETSKSVRGSICIRDSCLVALQTKQTEFEKYKEFNDRTVDYDKLERKLNEALGQLAQKDTVIRERLKTKAYELSVVKEKHDELMK
nr:hypothetical protein [Tanacetum cinerariifolium]